MKEGPHEAFVEFGTVKPPSDRRFGLTLGALLVALGAGRWWLGHGGAVAIAIIAVGTALILLGLAVPVWLGPLNRSWMRLGAVMAAIVNPLVMLLLFALIFTPVAFAMRLAGRDGLGLRRRTPGQSYWHERDHPGPAAERLRHQF